MDRGIVHRLNRALGISRRLPVVVHLGSSYYRPRTIGKAVVAQVSCESHIDPVGVLQQLILLAVQRRIRIGVIAWISEESGGKALNSLIGKGAATVDTIPD